MTQLKLKINHWGDVELDKKELRSLMRSAGNSIKTQTARLINQSSGSGRLYYGGGGSAYRGSYKAGRYRASAPGQPPVRVSGSLRNSLRVYTYPSGEGFAVRERQFYSLFLEAGARGGGNPGSRYGVRARRNLARRRRVRSFTARILSPRPHLDRVMEREAPELDRRVRKALAEGLKWRETKK
jgi:hypothetical protein